MTAKTVARGGAALYTVETVVATAYLASYGQLGLAGGLGVAARLVFAFAVWKATE